MNYKAIVEIVITIFLALVEADEIWNLHKLDLKKFPSAKCLDGSPGGFWFLPGYDDGVDKFMIHHQGGGWCTDYSDCYGRSLSDLGSSNAWEAVSNCDAGSTAQPCVYDGNEGITGFDANINPVTYNWNKIFIGYCDGASYSGHVEDAVNVPNSNNFIHFKGRFILDALYDTFLSEYGMNNASAVIISGTSAGGLAVYLHTDYLHDKIVAQSITAKPPRITAVPDAGFFMNLPSINGNYLYTPVYQNVFNMQQVSDSVNEACIRYYSATNETWKCFFAQYTLPFIKTEIFIANSLVDNWQGYNIMGITDCNPTVSGDCSADIIAYLNNFRASELEESSLKSFLKRPNAGAWLCECWTHPLLNWDYFWNGVKVEGWTLGKVFANWYARDKQAGPWVVVDGEWGSNFC